MFFSWSNKMMWSENFLSLIHSVLRLKKQQQTYYSPADQKSLLYSIDQGSYDSGATMWSTRSTPVTGWSFFGFGISWHSWDRRYTTYGTITLLYSTDILYLPRRSRPLDHFFFVVGVVVVVATLLASFRHPGQTPRHRLRSMLQRRTWAFHAFDWVLPRCFVWRLFFDIKITNIY